MSRPLTHSLPVKSSKISQKSEQGRTMITESYIVTNTKVTLETMFFSEQCVKVVFIIKEHRKTFGVQNCDPSTNSISIVNDQIRAGVRKLSLS